MSIYFFNYIKTEVYFFIIFLLNNINLSCIYNKIFFVREIHLAKYFFQGSVTVLVCNVHVILSNLIII
jgi:hypothetical protein